jgi:fatty acid desaturase
MTSPSPVSPPYLAEWILRRLVDAEDMDAILGDFAEEYHSRSGTKANWFYWRQTLGSCLPLIGLKVSRQLERSLTMLEKMPLVQNKRSFWVSLIALLPAFLLVTVGLLQSGFGITAPNDALDALFQKYAALKLIIHPLVLLGGLGVAVVLNLLPASQLRWSRESQSLSATITLKNNLLHWALVGISLMLLGIILVYSVIENFNIIPR